MTCHCASVTDHLPAGHWAHWDDQLPLPTPAAHLQLHELDEEAVLLDPQRGASFRLNPTVRLLWRCCQDRLTLGAAVTSLRTHYDVDEDRAREDTLQMLALLTAHDLLQDPEVQP